MKKIVLIDLGNTLIYNKKIDFNEGYTYLYSLINETNITKDVFVNEAFQLFQKMYVSRDIDLIEIAFQSFLKRLFDKLHVTSVYSFAELEKIIYDKTVKDEPIDGVLAFLDFLKSQNIPVYIISNSTFSSQCLRKTIDAFGISKFIQGLYSSADYGYRKPNRLFFEKIAPLQNIHKEETVMIGNDAYFDFEFAKNISVDFLWFNEKNEKKDEENIKSFRKYSELITKWGEIFD